GCTAHGRPGSASRDRRTPAHRPPLGPARAPLRGGDSGRRRRPAPCPTARRRGPGPGDGPPPPGRRRGPRSAPPGTTAARSGPAPPRPSALLSPALRSPPPPCRRRRLHHDSAVRAQHLTRVVGAVVRDQEEHGPRHVLGLPPAAERVFSFSSSRYAFGLAFSMSVSVGPGATEFTWTP